MIRSAAELLCITNVAYVCVVHIVLEFEFEFEILFKTWETTSHEATIKVPRNYYIIYYCILLCTRNTEEWWMRMVISLWPISCQPKRHCKREKTTRRFKFLTVMVKSKCVLLPSRTSGVVYLYAVCLQV